MRAVETKMAMILTRKSNVALKAARLKVKVLRLQQAAMFAWHHTAVLFRFTIEDGRQFIGQARHPFLDKLIEHLRADPAIEIEILAVGSVSYVEWLKGEAITAFRTLKPNGLNGQRPRARFPLPPPPIKKRVSA